MYTVGLDKFEGLILYSQLNKSKIEKSNNIDNANSNSNSFNLNEIKEIIFGSLLGDGTLEMSPRSVNARLGFTQAESQKDYFLSVAHSLSGLCSSKYREISYLDKRTGKTYKSLNFWSKALPMLNEFYFNFYVGKNKRVPSDLSLLTPLALAHWIMQDGSRGTSKGLYICTDSFTYDDIKRLTQYLRDRYNIICSIHKAGGNYRIYVLAKSVYTVIDLILPFMHESMLYKLGV